MGRGSGGGTQQVVRDVPEEAKPYLYGYGEPGDEDYIQGLLPRAQQLFTGQMPEYQVAGFNPDQQRAFELGRAGIGAYRPYLSRGSAALSEGLGTVGSTLARAQPFQQEGIGSIRQGRRFLSGAAQQYDPRSAQAYMDPYQEAVVETTLGDIERAGQRQLEDIEKRTGQAALEQGAFSGRRRFLEQYRQEEPVREDILRRQAGTAAQLRSQGYQTAQQQAQNAFEQQQRRQMGVGQMFGQLGTQAGQLGTSFGQLGMQGAQQFGQLGMQSAQMGGLAQQMAQSDVNLMSQLGAQQQRQRQAELDMTRANQMLPYQQVGFFSDIIQGAPIGTAQTSFMPGPSPFQQATGAAIAYGGLNRAGVFS